MFKQFNVEYLYYFSLVITSNAARCTHSLLGPHRGILRKDIIIATEIYPHCKDLFLVV